MNQISIDNIKVGSRVRRGPMNYERLSPCECCGYPISHRHHLDPVSECGENERTVQLCACCHELIHVIERVFSDVEAGRTAKVNKGRSGRVWAQCFGNQYRIPPATDGQSRISFLIGLLKRAGRLKGGD